MLWVSFIFPTTLGLVGRTLALWNTGFFLLVLTVILVTICVFQRLGVECSRLSFVVKACDEVLAFGFEV